MAPAHQGRAPGSGRLLEAHERLLVHYDTDRWHWQEATPPFEICLGAILVQHTAWSNVERALAVLQAAGVTSIETLARLEPEALAGLVRPAGTPTVKARRLLAFAALVLEYGGFEGLFAQPAAELRSRLLATPGIGPETADVILLYAAGLPVAVHDAYTARLCRRLGFGPEADRYETWRCWLDERLPPDLIYRQRSHAAIVIHCKETCRVKPRCEACPLTDLCEFYRAENDRKGRLSEPLLDEQAVKSPKSAT